MPSRTVEGSRSESLPGEPAAHARAYQPGESGWNERPAAGSVDDLGADCLSPIVPGALGARVRARSSSGDTVDVGARALGGLRSARPGSRGARGRAERT